MNTTVEDDEGYTVYLISYLGVTIYPVEHCTVREQFKLHTTEVFPILASISLTLYEKNKLIHMVSITPADNAIVTLMATFIRLIVPGYSPPRCPCSHKSASFVFNKIGKRPAV